MKKLVIATLAAAPAMLVQPAMAQSNVLIYGSLDAGLAYVSNIGGHSVARLDQGTMQPDRIGFRGIEDLGGGMRAVFQLETGFATDTGSQSNAAKLFNRAATVGIGSNFGTVLMGHMPDVVFDYAGKLSNGYQLFNFYLFHPGNLDNLANTYQFDNAVKYTSPIVGGFQMSAMYGFGEVAGDYKKGRNLSAGAAYDDGKLRAALAYTQSNDRPAGFGGTYLGSLGLGNATTVFNSLNTLAGGVGYTLGSWRLNALYTQVKMDLNGATPKQRNLDLGAAWRYNPANSLNLGYTRTKQEGAHWDQFSAGNAYSLSKRTELYAVMAYQKAGGDARFAIMNNTGVSGGSTQLLTAVGVHHSF
jgi:predicted porin